jgi:HK97 family phage prohead protease
VNPSQSFVRAFPTRLEESEPPRSDGARLLTGRLVPYDQATDVLDYLPNGRPDLYREGFRRGAFEPQVRLGVKVAKIGLYHTHDRGGGLGYLGPFKHLREQPDGLYGDIRILPTKADDLGALIEEGINELSIEFRLRGAANTVEADGVRWRTAVHLDHVALEAKGAYSGAEVLAFRQAVDDEAREAAEAEAKQAQEAAEREAAEAAEAERERAAALSAEEATERRRRWEELAGRLDGEKVKQASLVRTYGVVQPGGYRRQG